MDGQMYNLTVEEEKIEPRPQQTQGCLGQSVSRPRGSALVSKSVCQSLSSP